MIRDPSGLDQQIFFPGKVRSIEVWDCGVLSVEFNPNVPLQERDEILNALTFSLVLIVVEGSPDAVGDLLRSFHGQ